MFKKDNIVNIEIEKQSNLVNGSGDNTSKARRVADKIDNMPVIPIRITAFRLFSKVNKILLVVILLLNSLSFTRNWHQPLISVILAIPIIIEFVVSIYLVSSIFIFKKK